MLAGGLSSAMLRFGSMYIRRFQRNSDMEQSVELKPNPLAPAAPSTAPAQHPPSPAPTPSNPT